jgi:hypothetical protein
VPRANAETLARRFFDALGYWPDLENPRTFQEKFLWRKLYEDMSEATRLADKVAVREHVREVAGERYLVEVLAVVDDANDIDFDALPESFVLKVNRASGRNLIVPDKSKLDIDATRRVLNSLLRLPYGSRLGEHWYAGMPPKVVVERLLVDRELELPVNYRLHAFHGRVEYMHVTTGDRLGAGPVATSAAGNSIDTHHAKIAMFDRDWQPAPFYFDKKCDPLTDQRRRPAPLEEMLAVAETLADDWGYGRIDLYCVNDRDVYFSEITFAQSSGLFKLMPDVYNERVGSLWDVGRRYVRMKAP